ncbi:hypothetical protein M434DRAFT_175980 [Hypoxylon sp. CO27-5]|nr:hypothetical protein M434DRAFT_175980 [Hypoxylon sp. CO27-5]
MHTLANKVAWILTLAGSHDGIIRELESDNKYLSDKVHTFCQLRDKLRIPTWCFFELLDSDYGKKVGIRGWLRRKVSSPETKVGNFTNGILIRYSRW